MNRRQVLVSGAAASAVRASPSAAHESFVREAFRMRDDAVALGDQAYGAVVTLDGVIVGWGPSQVVSTRKPEAHAERVALWDAQKRLGRTDLSGAIIYSTSPPCAACQRALAEAQVSRLRYGREAVDLGAPRSGH